MVSNTLSMQTHWERDFLIGGREAQIILTLCELRKRCVGVCVCARGSTAIELVCRKNAEGDSIVGNHDANLGIVRLELLFRRVLSAQ